MRWHNSTIPWKAAFDDTIFDDNLAWVPIDFVALREREYWHLIGVEEIKLINLTKSKP